MDPESTVSVVMAGSSILFLFCNGDANINVKSVHQLSSCSFCDMALKVSFVSPSQSTTASSAPIVRSLLYFCSL